MSEVASPVLTPAAARLRAVELYGTEVIPRVRELLANDEAHTAPQGAHEDALEDKEEVFAWRR